MYSDLEASKSAKDLGLSLLLLAVDFLTKSVVVVSLAAVVVVAVEALEGAGVLLKLLVTLPARSWLR